MKTVYLQKTQYRVNIEILFFSWKLEIVNYNLPCHCRWDGSIEGKCHYTERMSALLWSKCGGSLYLKGMTKHYAMPSIMLQLSSLSGRLLQLLGPYTKYLRYVSIVDLFWHFLYFLCYFLLFFKNLNCLYMIYIFSICLLSLMIYTSNQSWVFFMSKFIPSEMCRYNNWNSYTV